MIGSEYRFSDLCLSSQPRDSVISGEVRTEYYQEPEIGKIKTNFTYASKKVNYQQTIAPVPRPLGIRIPRLCDFAPTMNPDQFERIKFLGKGAHSMIELVKCELDNRLYALKECPKNLVARFHKFQNIMREKDNMNMLNHPNIVRLENTFQDEENCYFLIEYHPCGDLASLIRKGKQLSLELTRLYAQEIINVLEHLRIFNMVHRDLKPENILIDSSMHCRVGDFGSSKIINLEKVKNDLKQIDDD